MERALVLLLSLAAILGSGCLDEFMDETSDLELDDAGFQEPHPKSDPAVEDPGAGERASHGEPEVTESAVQTGLGDDSRFHATKTVTIRNDFGGASMADILIDIRAGGIDFLPDSNGGYLYTIELDARGTTEAEAEQNLEETTVEHLDELQGDTLHLDTRVIPPGTEQVEVAGVTIGQVGVPAQVSAYVTAHLPPEVYYKALELDTSSGDIDLRDVRAGHVSLDSSSGDITADRVAAQSLDADASSGHIELRSVRGETLRADTSSGKITVTGRFHQVDLDASSGDITYSGVVDELVADASSGDIEVEATPARSGKYELGASSGSVSLTVPRAGSEHGYDIHASTSSGDIDVDVGDTESYDSDDDEVTARTAGYSRATVQTQIEADTSSGDIDILSQ